ncbi:MAG: 2-succinyl-5-enolpyruvyl-6-hydroxy-3-cyclohexene-1-carboxylic-acid synthase [Solirubrobacteraceae bacterium]
MAGADDKHALIAAFVDELARCGVRDACTAPGSRNTPLLIGLAREARLRCHSHIDERAAGFFALGIAKASGLPVAVTCTSGTAAAELLPAAIEAREARVPLLLLTADRPPELRDVGAGQAIDQVKLYGSAAKWFAEVDLEGIGAGGERYARTLACRAYATALEGRPGAVHLNFPLREPLVPPGALPQPRGGRAGGMPFVDRTPRAPRRERSPTALRELAAGSRRGVLVAGREERGRPPRDSDRSVAAAAAEFCASSGWPLLADPLSSARRGAGAIAHYDALLRQQRLLGELKPDFVLRIGDLPTSKPLRSWLASLDGVPQVALDPEGAWQDPASALSASLAVDPAAALWELTPERRADATVGELAAEADWLPRWRAADASASEAIAAVLASEPISEPAVARELGVLLPEEATLFVASSMPVRDIETFWPARDDPPRVLCNRGANGIDGTVSSAFGVAAAEDGPVVLLIGDVALAHDLSGLIAASRLELKLTIVLLNNGGGGIFDFLPIASAQSARAGEERFAAEDLYTRHVATPTGLDFADAAALYRLRHQRVEDVPSFRAALERCLAEPGSAILEARTDRQANVELHRRVWKAVCESAA